MELEIPYYWNIAANRDMTVALRGISKRGMMGKAEYRYLGLGFEGEIKTNMIYDTSVEGFRGLFTAAHKHRTSGWDISTVGAYSRTRDFIDDFEQNLVEKGANRLESHISANRLWSHTNGYLDAQAGLLWYQDLEQSNDDFTVQSLPYISISDDRPLSKMADGRRWRLQSDARFDSFINPPGMRFNGWI